MKFTTIAEGPTWNIAIAAPIRLNIGAGLMPIPGYRSVDSQAYPGIDLVCRIPPLPYADGEVQDIYAGHVLEHIPPLDLAAFLTECVRVLAPGGSLTVVCPDSDKARLMLESNRIAPLVYAEVISGARHADMPHYTLWTSGRLQAALRSLPGVVLDPAYRWQADERVYDRSVVWQCGGRVMKQ